MEGKRTCAVVGCNSVRMWRQQCEKHARRLLAFEPLLDQPAPPPPPTVVTCPECGEQWARPHGHRARFCSDACRYADAVRRSPSPNVERDEAIRAAVANGELHREVAAKYGISAPRVWQVMNGWKPVGGRRSAS